MVTTYDVLHDAPHPAKLVDEVAAGLATGGVWLLGDVACLDGIRENVASNPSAAKLYGVSACLCMACGLSEPGGAGLGTLGFTEKVARDMLLGRGIFSSLRVLHEQEGMRWFEALR